MEFLKKLIIALLSLLLITTLVLWVVAKSVKPEVVKQYVSSQLFALTHQKSSVDGDISWQIFPQPAIKITRIKIGGENNQTNYSITLENLLFNLQITPLLRGKLVFNELLVDGFKIKIYPDAPSTPEKTKAITQTDEVTTSTAEQFAIERFLLSHGQVVIEQNQRTITLSGLQIGAQQFNLQKKLFPLQFKTNLDVATANEKILKAHINFKGNTSLSSSLFCKPITTLQNTPLDGQLSLQNVKLNQLKINKISAHTKTKPGVFLLNLLTLNLYNGESVGDLSYEFASKKITINQTATNLDGAKLINDLLHKILFTGSVDFSIHAQANLQEANWQDNITGNGSLTIKDGAVESINLDKVIEYTSNKINNLLTNKEAAIGHPLDLKEFANADIYKGSTNFNLLTLQYHWQNAKLASNSLVLQTDKLQIKGDSILHLKENNLDSHLLAKVISADNNIDKIQQLLGGTFPILLQGTLTEPTVLPDLPKINPILPIKAIVNKP
jgi:AsmA protein